MQELFHANDVLEQKLGHHFRLKASRAYQVTRIMSKITYHTDKKHHASKEKIRWKFA